MEVIDIIGYLAALLIGLVLGLIGGGGSILTVPVLVYLLSLDAVTATAYSLFIVGITALVGMFRNIPKKLVDFKTAILFSIPAFMAVYISRKFIVPAIPKTILTISDFELNKDMGLMLFFALIMLLAAWSMIRSKKHEKKTTEKLSYNIPLIIIEGLLVGIVTGLVGAGGGFLIIPALVLLAKLPMKKAVATSLLIISIKSLFGFIGDIENMSIDWLFLLSFSACSVAGIFLGIYLGQFIEGKKLKKSFGWFVLVMAIFIVYQELSQ